MILGLSSQKLSPDATVQLIFPQRNKCDGMPKISVAFLLNIQRQFFWQGEHSMNVVIETLQLLRKGIDKFVLIENV